MGSEEHDVLHDLKEYEVRDHLEERRSIIDVHYHMEVYCYIQVEENWGDNQQAKWGQ